MFPGILSSPNFHSLSFKDEMRFVQGSRQKEFLERFTSCYSLSKQKSNQSFQLHTNSGFNQFLSVDTLSFWLSGPTMEMKFHLSMSPS